MWNSIAIFTAVHSVTISASGEIELPHNSLIQLGLRGNLQETKSKMTAATGALKKTSTAKKTDDVVTSDFVNTEYANIFPEKNRNAAAHRWFNYLYEHAEAGGTFDPDFATLNKFYCPVSGSPTNGGNLAPVELPSVTGGKKEGAFSFCCSPCFCDLQDFVQVDTITVSGTTYDVLVIGDPCTNADIIRDDGLLDVPFADPWNPDTTDNLAESANDVRCEKDDTTDTYSLQGATKSDNGYIVIGLLHLSSDATVADLSNEMDCANREASGYVGGMGDIFRKVAEQNPISTS
jgi:hypothetical protein